MASDTRLRMRRRAFTLARETKRQQMIEGSRLRTFLYYEVYNTDAKIGLIRREKEKMEHKLMDLKALQAQRVSEEMLRAHDEAEAQNEAEDGNNVAENTLDFDQDYQKEKAELDLFANKKYGDSISASKRVTFRDEIQEGEKNSETEPAHVPSLQLDDPRDITTSALLIQTLGAGDSSAQNPNSLSLNRTTSNLEDNSGGSTSARQRHLEELLALLPDSDRAEAMETQRSSDNPFSFSRHVYLGVAKLHLNQAIERGNTFIKELNEPRHQSPNKLSPKRALLKRESTKNVLGFNPNSVVPDETLEFLGSTGFHPIPHPHMSQEDQKQGELALLEKDFGAMLREAKKARYVRKPDEKHQDRTINLGDIFSGN